MNYCVRCGVWQAALSPCISYLLREAICSSERPPSSSFIINNLSLRSFGCTGKLLRKISVGTVHIQKITHAHTHIQSWDTPETTFPDSTCDEKLQAHFEDKRVVCLITSLYMIQGEPDACWFALYKTWIDGNFILPNKPSCAEVANRKKGINNGSCGGWDDAHYSNIFILWLSGTRFKGTITMLSLFFLFAQSCRTEKKLAFNPVWKHGSFIAYMKQRYLLVFIHS